MANAHFTPLDLFLLFLIYQLTSIQISRVEIVFFPGYRNKTKRLGCMLLKCDNSVYGQGCTKEN